MKSRSLVLLSGEGTTIPAAEAKACFLADDPWSRFESPEPRVIIAESAADPFRVGARVAFARRVGFLVHDMAELRRLLDGHRMRYREFVLGGEGSGSDPAGYLEGLDVSVDLRDPELELTIVRGQKEYVSVTAPLSMNQGWSTRRPRRRPFFHPSAIFPKLARALVNLSRCREGDLFLDPFSGTGSIPIEAHLVGARVVAADLSDLMVRGALRNMRHFEEEWLGAIRADSADLPVRGVRAMATDVPYGRVSSTRGRGTKDIVERLIQSLPSVMAPRSVLVLMHPQLEPLVLSPELSLLEEHHLQVHKRLTRTISVLERR